MYAHRGLGQEHGVKPRYDCTPVDVFQDFEVEYIRRSKRLVSCNTRTPPQLIHPANPANFPSGSQPGRPDIVPLYLWTSPRKSHTSRICIVSHNTPPTGTTLNVSCLSVEHRFMDYETHGGWLDRGEYYDHGSRRGILDARVAFLSING